MALSPIFNPLPSISSTIFIQAPVPGILSVTNESGDHGGGGSAPAAQPAALARLDETGLLKGTKPSILLVTMMPDDSGSITQYGNAPAIRRGHNAYLEGFARAQTTVLVRTRYLNGTELFPFCKPSQAIRMDERNYAPHLQTPFYDQSYTVLQEVLSAAAVYADRHKDHDILTMTFLMTDGADTGSKTMPEAVKAIVDRMFASGRHIVAGIGVRDAGTDFPKVFAGIGIPEQWIQVLEREEGDIVKGMTSAARTTSTVADVTSFTQTSRTGFTGVVPPKGAPASPTQPSAPSPRVVIHPPKGGPVIVDPAAPRQERMTAVQGASAIGNMMGATMKRDDAELGRIAPSQLAWEPAPMAYYFDETGAMDSMPSPLQWNASAGLYALPLPQKDVLYLFGRDTGLMQEDVRQRILSLLKSRREKNKNIRLVFIPLRDRREHSPVSRLHAIMGAFGKGAHTAAAVDGDLTVISGDDPSSDRYQQGTKGKPDFVDSGNLIKLAPRIVFRVI